MSRPLRMGTAAAVVAGSVLFSRLLGLGREALLAGLFGVGVEADLYKQAFLIPDFLNYLLAGAYLTITLIPILSRHIEAGHLDRASRAFTSVLRFVAIAVVVLTVLMWVLADGMVSLVYPEVIENHDRLVSMTRVVLPAQVFLVVGALLMAVQYTHRRFVLPALAPLIYNLAIIAGGLLGAMAGDASPESFLWGAVVGSAVGNFGLQWWGARRTGTWLMRPLKGESSIGEYFLLALPLMIGQSVAVLDEQFIRFFGQVEEGATSALGFARQLNMVPVGVIAQAAGVAAYPFLARLAARGENDALVDTTVRAARNTLFVAAAATAGLIGPGATTGSTPLPKWAVHGGRRRPGRPPSDDLCLLHPGVGSSSDPVEALLRQAEDVDPSSHRHCFLFGGYPGLARPVFLAWSGGFRPGVDPSSSPAMP